MKDHLPNYMNDLESTQLFYMKSSFPSWSYRWFHASWICILLIKSPRSYSIATRIDCSGNYINGINLLNYHTTCINIIRRFLVIYTKISRRSPGRSQSRINAILQKIERFDIFGEDAELDLPDAQHMLALDISTDCSMPRNNHHTHSPSFSIKITDLQNGIQAMVSLFPESTHPSGGGHEPSLFVLIPSLNRWTLWKSLLSISMLFVLSHHG